MLAPAWAWAEELPRDIKVTRIVGFDLVSERAKLVGKNSRLCVHGRQATDRMVRLFTNAGIEGIGKCRASEEALGHRAFKVTIGRGAKRMPAEEGYARDVEVLRTIRRHARPEVLIGVDANNGYDLPKTKRLLEELGDFDFAFLEEILPEEVEKCLELKQFIREHGWKTLVADGETQGDLEAYKPFIEAEAIDIFQGDMNRFGLEGILTEAEWCRPKGLRVAPHNWGSLVGYYMQLHVGRAITNLYRSEHDPLSNSVLVAEGYEGRKGYAGIPNAPWFGLKINKDEFASDVRIRLDLKV